MLNRASEKARARLQARKIRANVAASLPAAEAPLELIRHFPAVRFRRCVVGGYWAIRDEINVSPLLQALHASSVSLALPCTPRAGHALSFRQWTPHDPLMAGRYHTREPAADAPLSVPDLILVPLLAYTAQGERLGYGGGYYDRTLAQYRTAGGPHDVFACGVAYGAQEAHALPTDDLDQNLDGILTEDGFKVF